MATLGDYIHWPAVEVHELKTNPNYGETEQNPIYTIITYITFPSKWLDVITIIPSTPIWTHWTLGQVCGVLSVFAGHSPDLLPRRVGTSLCSPTTSATWRALPFWKGQRCLSVTPASVQWQCIHDATRLTQSHRSNSEFPDLSAGCVPSGKLSQVLSIHFPIKIKTKIKSHKWWYLPNWAFESTGWENEVKYTSQRHGQIPHPSLQTGDHITRPVFPIGITTGK